MLTSMYVLCKQLFTGPAVRHKFRYDLGPKVACLSLGEKVPILEEVRPKFKVFRCRVSDLIPDM